MKWLRSFWALPISSGWAFTSRLAILSPPGTGEDEVDIVRAAGGADEPLVPVADGGIGAVTGGLCGGIRLGLAAAGLAPHDQPDLSRSGPSQRHRRTAVGLHRPRLWRVLALGGS